MSKHILITGGCSGLGRCLVDLYIERGDNVTVLDIETNAGEELTKLSEQLTFMEYNLADDQSLKIAEPIDTLICNAGISLSGNFTELSFEQEQNVFTINTLGHIRLIKKLLQANLLQGKGQIGLVCSATQFLPFPIALSYAASKGALDAFGKALESYLIGKHIGVTRIYPGPMQTPHVQYYKEYTKGKGAHPQKIADRIIQALHKRKRICCPDTASRLLRIANVFLPYFLAKRMYKEYFKTEQEHILTT